MKIELNQKLGRDKRKFYVKENKLYLEYNIERQILEYDIDIESLNFDEIILNKSPDYLAMILWFSVFFNMITFASILESYTELGFYIILLLVIPFLIGLAFIVQSTNFTNKSRGVKVLDKNQRDVKFLYTEKHREEVDRFISKLKKVKKDLIISKYLTYDELLPEDLQLQQALILYRERVISKEEYDSFLKDIEIRSLLK